MALSGVAFLFRFPHAKTVVGLRLPILQIGNHDFLVGFGPRDALQYHFSISIVHFGVRHSGCLVNIPGKCLRVHRRLFPLEGI